jgi:hypothetical protein
LIINALTSSYCTESNKKLCSKYNVTAEVKDLNVKFSRGLDISVFKLNILTVVDNHTTWSDYFGSDFVQLYFNFVRHKFRAKTAFTLLSLPSRIGVGGEHSAV